MANTITNRQMVFILIVTLMSISVITMPKVMAEQAGVGNWIPIMITAVVFGILVTFLAKLNRAFPGMALYDYSRELVGKTGCCIIAVFYVLYFLKASVYMSSHMAEMLRANFLFETPYWAFLLAGIPVFGYLAYQGPVITARIFELYGVVGLAVLIITHTNMMIQGDVNNILPFIVPSEIGRSLGAVKEAVIAFLGIEVLTVMPFSKKNKRAPWIAFLVLLAIGVIYVVVVESSIMMVGLDEIKYYEYPLFSAIRQIELEKIEFLKRLDVLYLTAGLMSVFAVVAVLYLAAVEYTVKLLPRVKRLVIVIGVGIAIFVGSIIGPGIDNFNEIITQYTSYTGLIAAGFIPIGLWVIAKVKKRA